MKKLLPVLALCLCATALHAGELIKLYAGGNLVYFDGARTLPSDFEVGGAGRVSLSPHISVVAASFYNIDKSYLSGAAGGRITAPMIALSARSSASARNSLSRRLAPRRLRPEGLWNRSGMPASS